MNSLPIAMKPLHQFNKKGINMMKKETAYYIIERDGKEIITSSEVLKHIALHDTVGTGSCFAEDFRFSLNMIPNKNIKPGANTLTLDERVGNLLVDKFESALTLPDATLGSAYKETTVDGVTMNLPVPSVSTSKSLESFSTNELTFLVFPYNPDFATDELKDFIETVDMPEAWILATAFPGSLKIKGEDVPPINDGAWDGRWAVILPEPLDPGE